MPGVHSGDWTLDVPCGGDYLRGDSIALRIAWAALVPEASILFLEGGAHPPPVRTFLEKQAVPPEARVRLGTGSARHAPFHTKPTAPVLRDSAELADPYAASELAITYTSTAVRASSYSGIMHSWTPSTFQTVFLSERLEAFCAKLGSSFRDLELPDA